MSGTGRVPAIVLLDGVHALVVRTAGILAVAATVARVSLYAWAGVPVTPGDLVLHGTVLLTGGAVAALAHQGQGHSALRALAVALCGNMALAQGGLLALTPEAPWRYGAILMATQLASPFIGSWSWRWQAGLSTGVVAVTLAAVTANAGIPVPLGFDVVVVIAAAGIAGTLGAHLIHSSRTRLALSEVRYRTLFRDAADAIAVLDGDGTIIECNAAFEDLVGARPGSVPGTAGTLYMDPMQPGGRPLPASFTEHLARALAGETIATIGRMRTASGGTVEVDIRLAGSTTPHGRQVQAIVRDHSLERATERQLEREARLEAVRRLAGGVAHEFNTLLGTIRTHVSLLRDHATAPDDREALAAVLEQTIRGADLARELLQFGQQHTLQFERIETIPLLETVQVLARAALIEGIAVEMDLPATLPPVRGDRDALLHAALQIALNTRDAMDETGTLTLSAALVHVAEGDAEWPEAEAGDYLRITFRDTGRGMDEHTLERVFEPFFSTRPLWAARGTGLSAVYGIMRAHRGGVRIQSWKGRGTAVHLLVPVWRAPTPARVSPAKVRPARAHVLVVDDDTAFRASMLRALGAGGFLTSEAGDLPQAVSAFHAAVPPVDVLLLDFVLPGGGPAIFDALRAERPDLPVLICTGYTADEDARLAAMCAQRDVRLLRKPFDVQELYAELGWLLGDHD